eukprot:gene2456-7772_t
MTQHYVPPTNFGLVEEDLYRSGQPNEVNFPFLEKLKLRAVVYISPEDPSESFKEFVADHKIEFHHVGQEVRPSLAGSGSSVSEEMVLSALAVVLDRSKYPLLIACNLGRHHTGTVVGCLRKLQRWNLTSIVEEYRRYAGSKVRLLNEQFIEFFDTELVSTPSISPPAWL